MCSFTGDQRIQELKVSCANRKHGCSWTGELRFLEGHMTTCSNNIVTCPKKCGTDYSGKPFECFLKDLDLHLREACPLRDYKCPRCQKWGTYAERISSHLRECPMMPARCPNKGCNKEVPSHLLKTHTATCDFALEDCKYRDLGCTNKVLHRDMKKHESDDQFHFHLLMRTVMELQGKLLQVSQELSLLRNTTSSAQAVTFRVTGFSKYKENEMFFSKPFYTSPRGYKLCVRIIPKWQDKKVCVCIHLMHGEFDGELKWPYTGTLEVELLNQLEDSRHISRTIQYPGEEGMRVEKGKMKEVGYGYYDFITHDKLHRQQKQLHGGPVFLVEDSLYFRVIVKRTWLECTQPTD